MKNKGALRLLLSANIVSGFAQGISMLAIPWYFTSVVNEASLFATIFAVTTFTSLFWNLYAGTLIDRYPRKMIFIYVSLVCGTILLSTAILGYSMGYVPLGLAGLVFVTTMFNYNIHFGTLYAFGQEISDRSQYGKISSYLEIQNQTTSVFSGAFAAMLLTGVEAGKEINIAGFVLHLPFSFPKWDLQDIFLLDGITYFAAIVLVSLIKYKPEVARLIDKGSIVNRVKAGLSYLRQHPALFAFGNYSYSIFVVLMVQLFLLVPLYVNNHLQRGSDVFASVEVFYSLGAMLAGIFIRKILLIFHTVKAIIILMLLTTIIFFVVSVTQTVGIFYAFSFLIGITNAGTRVLRTTFLFNHISNDIIGRTNSVFSVINILFRSAFIFLFSIAWFSSGSHVVWAYAACGTFVLGSALLLIKNYKRIV